jgi:hypothetical protein
MVNQTTVQDSTTIRFGSGKFEVGPDIAGLIDLGAMTGITFTETFEKVKVNSDNAGEISSFIRNHKATLSGDMLEVNLANLNIIRGGVDTYTPAAGTEVSGHSEIITTGTWDHDQFIELPHQMYDLSKITPTSVTASTHGVLVLNTDYFIVQDPGTNKWGIAVKDTGVTDAENITVVYTYTPAASKTLTSGGKTTIAAKVVRVTNIDSSTPAKVFRITLFKASNSDGISMTFQSDEQANGPNTVRVTMEGVCDATAAVGAQLFEIYDTQSA